MDSYKTPSGEILVEHLGHASLVIKWNDLTIYSDPYSEVADFAGRDKADLILITHNHYDHYDEKAFKEIETPNTLFVVSENVGKVDARYVVLANGESFNFDGVDIQAVPSYNINRRNEEGNLFHPQGVGNGYLLEIDGVCLYIAGDTEPVAEMDGLPAIDIAFLPKNLPYTMTDDEFAALANKLNPKYLYPIHYFELDVQKIRGMVNDNIILKTNIK